MDLPSSPDHWSKMSDEESVISAKINSYHFSKVGFPWSFIGKRGEKWKNDPNFGFSWKSESPAALGLLGPISAIFSTFFQFLFLLHIFLDVFGHFLTFFSYSKFDGKTHKIRSKVSKFVGKLKTFVAKRCCFVASSRNLVKWCWNDLKFGVNLLRNKIRPSAGSDMKIITVRGPVVRGIHFIARKILHFET